MFDSMVMRILVYLALLAQIIFFVVVSLLFFERPRFYISDFISKNISWLSFAIAMTATLGSLFFSEIKGFNPCKLCWYQRIFMYPQVFLMGMAMLKKEKTIYRYSLLLLLVGALVALYHNFIIYFPSKAVICSASGALDSCVTKFVLGLGYVTIPLMSLTAFALLSLFHVIFIWRNNS